MLDNQKSSPCREKSAVGSDKIDSEEAVKENPKIQSPKSPAVNNGNLSSFASFVSGHRGPNGQFFVQISAQNLSKILNV